MECHKLILPHSESTSIGGRKERRIFSRETYLNVKKVKTQKKDDDLEQTSALQGGRLL